MNDIMESLLFIDTCYSPMLLKITATLLFLLGNITFPIYILYNYNFQRQKSYDYEIADILVNSFYAIYFSSVTLLFCVNIFSIQFGAERNINWGTLIYAPIGLLLMANLVAITHFILHCYSLGCFQMTSLSYTTTILIVGIDIIYLIYRLLSIPLKCTRTNYLEINNE